MKMRLKFLKNYRLIGLISCLFLLLPTASFGQEGQTRKQVANTLRELLDGDGPLYDLIYDLEECYDKHLEVLREEERSAQAEREKVYEDFFKRMEELVGERRDIQRLASEYDLQALFPGSAVERFLRCQHHLRMARLKLKTARDLNDAYREVLVKRGAAKFFPEETPEDWDLWQMEIDAFECSKSEARPPLQTQVRIPAGARRPFVFKTFCLDKNKLGPGDGQALEIVGQAASLGRANLEQQLKDAAAHPAREIDIQRAIWEESKDEEAWEYSPSLTLKPVHSDEMEPSENITDLAGAVSDKKIHADLKTREDFTSVEVWLENKSGEEKVINVSGTVFGSGDESVQRLVAAGVDTEQPPPGPDPKSPEQTLEEIKDEVAKRLEEAMERVQNGDHSQEALKELLEAMEAARNVGLEEPLEGAWDVFRDGLWEETVSSYNDYKSEPNDANRTEILENLETVRQVDPPEGKEEAFNRMLEDILGIPKA